MASSLAHVMVVAGDRHEWAALDDAGWQSLADELGAVVAAAGCAWLTLRMYEAGGEDAPGGITLHRHDLVAAGGQCTVIIDPVGDGRQRFAEAMALVPAAVPIDEKAVASALYDPADVEPDLVLVLGPSTRLPPSLVWELAYGELVFVSTMFAELRRDHLLAAIDEFHGRRRRFGGLESASVRRDRPDAAGWDGQDWPS
ncbi:MAG: undecaprenyl diphosphate synthase family protein [Ilumatobacteraceae bacterium]